MIELQSFTFCSADFSCELYSIMKPILVTLLLFPWINCYEDRLPLVINTWAFTDANAEGFGTLKDTGSVVDAVEAGCTVCEIEQCDGTVGYGGSPDENGETTLDAMIMDGATMDVGAVAALRNVKSAVRVARAVMERSEHTLLVGSQASEFAFQMGFAKESLTTNHSTQLYHDWKMKSCQPNFWINVVPDPKQSCGPYKPNKEIDRYSKMHHQSPFLEKFHHDTIGMVAIDKYRRVAVATSTNGAIHKIPGRVGDSPIVGSGGYCMHAVGGAAATGDGDVLMRFLPSFKAVEGLRMGFDPTEAAISALATMVEYVGNFVGAVVVARVDGAYGAACYGIEQFPYSVTWGNLSEPKIETVQCMKRRKMKLNPHPSRPHHHY